MPEKFIRKAAPLLAAAGLILLSFNPAAAQNVTSKYYIKNSEVQLPDGVEWGQYKRTIQPFENWTLICDENLTKKERVCNLSQIIVDASGNQIFSWSLAATTDGAPFMILRVPGNTDQKTPIRVGFSGRDTPVNVPYKGCTETVCVAMMPVGPITREHIDKGSDVTINFTEKGGRSVEVIVPLKGLKLGITKIK